MKNKCLKPLLALLILSALHAAAQPCLQLFCPTNVLAFTCTNCATASLGVTALDPCCSNSNPLVSYQVGGVPIDTNYCFPFGQSLVQVTATDGCGGSNACSFFVTVVWNTNGIVISSCPTNIPVCTGSSGCGFMPDATGEIQAGAGVLIAQSISPGTLLCGNTTVTFSLSDACGNVAQTNLPCVLVNCPSNCLQNFNCLTLQHPTNILVSTCSNCAPVALSMTATDLCCSVVAFNYQVNGVTIPPNYCFPLGVTTVFVTASDCCTNEVADTFDVTVTSCTAPTGPCCGPGLGPQTIHWLAFPTNGTVLSDPSGTNPPGSWLVTNLPCYGRVLVTQTFPDPVSYALNTNFANVPNPKVTFNFTESGYGPYSWGTGASWMSFLATNDDSYTVTFYFLDGPPSPCNLVLGVAGLAESTTATVSQPVTFRTELDVNSPFSDGTFSAETTLNNVYGPPIAGSVGAIVGNAYNQAVSGDHLNTGLAMLQPVDYLAFTNLPAGSVQGYGGSLNNLPYLSLSVFQQTGDGIGFTAGYICCTNPCLQVQVPTNILVYSCTNVSVAFPQPVVSDCCGTNWSVVFNPPSGTSFAPGKASLVNWSVYDCTSTNPAASGSFWVSVFCTNCCLGPVTNYTVSVVQGSNYLADCLCQGTNNTLADVLTNVPVGTKVYFWNAAAGQFTPPDAFTGTGWQNGTEPLFPGEGFLLVSTNQYLLTIYGSEPGCGGACAPLTCSSPTALIGDYGIYPNPVPFCDLVCCDPPVGTQVQVWNPTSQSFTTYTYTSVPTQPWSPALPPDLSVGYSEFVSVNQGAPVINCPGNLVINACGTNRVFFNVSASNTFGGTLLATANPPSGSFFSSGTTNTVSCSVTNPCGGIDTCSFTITVVCLTNAIHIVNSGGFVNVTWPAGQGYHLQFQTNGLSPAGWMTATGILDGSYHITVDSAKATFYRLKYP